MAIKKCKECGKDVSTKADKCPSCGAPLKSKIGCGGLLLLIFLLAGFAAVIDQGGSTPKTAAPPKKLTKAEIRQEKIDNCFSAWDGSHRGLATFIKNTMNDPDSFKHDETVFWDKGDHLIVKTTFFGKNKFGGVVKNWISAKADLNGNVIEIIDQGS